MKVKSVYMPNELIESIVQFAQEERRTFSQMCLILLEDAVRRRLAR